MIFFLIILASFYIAYFVQTVFVEIHHYNLKRQFILDLIIPFRRWVMEWMFYYNRME